MSDERDPLGFSEERMLAGEASAEAGRSRPLADVLKDARQAMTDDALRERVAWMLWRAWILWREWWAEDDPERQIKWEDQDQSDFLAMASIVLAALARMREACAVKAAGYVEMPAYAPEAIRAIPLDRALEGLE